MIEKKIYRLENIRQIDGVKIFTFFPIDGKNIQFKPGQFVRLYQLDEELQSTGLSRFYSIASAPFEPYLEFCIKITGGVFTSYLDTLKPGDRIGIEGPFGHFQYGGENMALFIAGGVGVAPFLSILRYIARERVPGDFILLYSSKTLDQTPYYQELNALCSTYSNIKVIHTFTQHCPPGWKWEVGRINPEMLKRDVPKLAERRCYLCGPPAMVTLLKEMLLRLGIPENNIKMEVWG